MKFQIPAVLATTLAVIGQVAGVPLESQELEKRGAPSETKPKPEPVGPILGEPISAPAFEKRAAEPGTAESNDQFVEVRNVPDS